MEKLSSSRHTQRFVGSPAPATKMQKRKSTMIGSPIPLTKNPKIATDRNRRIQRLNTQDQNLTQGIDPSQLMDDNPLACISSQINHRQFVSLTNDQKTRFKELEDRRARAVIKQEKLRRKLKTLDENGEAMDKYIQDEMKIREEISEKQNISTHFQTAAQDQITELTDVLRGCRERKEQLMGMSNSVITKQYQEQDDMIQQMKEQLSKMKKKHADRLKSKENDDLVAKAIADQLDKELMSLTLIESRIDKQQKECDSILQNKQQLYNEGMRKINDSKKNLEAELNSVQERNNKSVAEVDEQYEMYEARSSEYQVLQVTATEKKELINEVKSSIEVSIAKQENLRAKIEELKSANLEIISKRDVECTDYRKQLQDSTSIYTEMLKKLSDLNSKNENLSNSITRTVKDNEELEKILHDKDNEALELREKLTGILKSNEKLEEPLIAVKKQISQKKADFESFAAQEDETADQGDETEMQAKLADIKQLLKDNADFLIKVRDATEADSLKFIQRKKMCDQEIDKLDEQLDKLEKTKEIFLQEIAKLDSENNKKLQELSQSLMQCQKAGHENMINELNEKKDALRKEILAEKVKYRQELIVQTSGTICKEIGDQEAELRKYKSKADDLDKRIVAAEEMRDNLKRKLNKSQTLSNDSNDSNAVPETSNQSPLLGVIFTKSKSTPAASTPVQSLQLGGSICNIFEESPDESSIDSLNIEIRRFATPLQKVPGSQQNGRC